jgi:hypothetical protein
MPMLEHRVYKLLVELQEMYSRCRSGEESGMGCALAAWRCKKGHLAVR